MTRLFDDVVLPVSPNTNIIVLHLFVFQQQYKPYSQRLTERLLDRRFLNLINRIETVTGFDPLSDQLD